MSNSTNKPLNVLSKFVNTNVTIKLKNNINYANLSFVISEFLS